MKSRESSEPQRGENELARGNVPGSPPVTFSSPEGAQCLCRPFRAIVFLRSHIPRRCPGLSHFALSGLRIVLTIALGFLLGPTFGAAAENAVPPGPIVE